MPRAKETIFPFDVSLLLHQQAQSLIASLDCNEAECGLMEHWSCMQAFGDNASDMVSDSPAQLLQAAHDLDYFVICGKGGQQVWLRTILRPNDL